MDNYGHRFRRERSALNIISIAAAAISHYSVSIKDYDAVIFSSSLLIPLALVKRQCRRFEEDAERMRLDRISQREISDYIDENL